MALGSAAAAHRAAEAIVAENRFHQSPVPDPLHGVVSWVGNAVTDPLNAIGRLVSHIGDVFPGGVPGVWAFCALLLTGAIWVLVVRRAHTQLGLALDELTGGVLRETPSELEREALAAERAQRWDEAVRLRFRAGILRLGRQLELDSPETVPNHTLGRLLRSARFDSLTVRFDEVAYGAGTATQADAEQQRREWPQVLDEASRR